MTLSHEYGKQNPQQAQSDGDIERQGPHQVRWAIVHVIAGGYQVFVSAVSIHKNVIGTIFDAWIHVMRIAGIAP